MDPVKCFFHVDRDQESRYTAFNIVLPMEIFHVVLLEMDTAQGILLVLAEEFQSSQPLQDRVPVHGISDI